MAYLKSKFTTMLLVLSTGLFAQRPAPTLPQNSIPLFANPRDSAAYFSLLEQVIRISQNLDTKEPGKSGAKLDSLLLRQAGLQEKILGYKIYYRATHSFTSYDDLKSGRVKPDAVTQLSIADVRLTELPMEVYSCKNLRELELVNTSIRSLPAALKELNQLKGIYMYNNVPTGRLKLGRNDRVSMLVLQGIPAANLPRNYKNFARLESLDLSRNIGMMRFPKIHRNKALVKLNLIENNLTLSDLRRGNASVQDINLQKNRIGRVPAAIGKFPNLRKLGLNANAISKVHPSIGKLTKLEALAFYQNKLTDIPEGVYSLGNLRIIDLYYNKLERIDPRISNLTNLRILYLSYNQLALLPESIGKLANLQELYVHDNKLSALPESINNLKQLRVFRVNNNFISSLPNALQALTELENLDVSRNYLYQFPMSWGELSKLQMLGIMNNPWERREEVEKVVQALRDRGVVCLYSEK